jgi:raffinose/stachyose/melibiose transport system substrate-binding protein
VGLAGCTSSGSSGNSSGDAGKTFTILQYEDPTTPQGQGWQKALEIFKAKHPDVKVSFQQTSFDALRVQQGQRRRRTARLPRPARPPQ